MTDDAQQNVPNLPISIILNDIPNEINHNILYVGTYT